MSLPWVSREHYDLLSHNYEQAWVQIRAERTIAETRYDALLEKYHALKLQGAEAPPTIADLPLGVSRGPDPDAELKLLIAEQAGTDLRRRGMMLRQLRQDRADGVSPEEIRRSIERGVQSDGIPA
jgi:hypothetical protein